MKNSRNLWPFGILTAFGLFFVGMATAVTIALTHGENLVSPNYYEQELKYQDQINAAAHAGAAGATVRLDAAAGRMIVSVPVGQLKQNLTGKISFYRANDPTLDREVVFAPGADGTQTFKAAGFVAGLWRVRVAWSAGGQDYFLEQKIKI
jgi:nitrogen fixation protein FixH